MTDFENTPFDPHAFDERLEAYLDGVMAHEDRVAFEAQLATNPRLAAEVALQTEIDASLERMFPLVAAPATHVAALERHADATVKSDGPATIKIRWPWLVGVAAAAAAACLAFAFWDYSAQDERAPHFAPGPLAQIYEKTVDEGFEPYYECRDDERFVDTFRRRQGIALGLEKLPLGSVMKGLSYPGGLSRETTAMLCDVEGAQVMVFVDREENDQKIAGENSDPHLHVFREARDGLVFYEVTPLEKPTMMQYLQVEEN